MIAKYTTLISILVTLLAMSSSQAQDSLEFSDSIIYVGIKDSPPFVNIREGFQPEGMSIEFWNQVQESAQVNYKFVPYQSLKDLTHALEIGEVDLSINPITVTEERMKLFDFSQPYYISGTAIASERKSLLVTMFNVIFSFDFLYALSSFIVVIGIVGILIWLVERRRNRSMFHPGAHGIGDGIWWSAVTMTTVGFGDKVPKTKMGRIIGFFWMFAAIVLLSGLTAFITSSLTSASAEQDVKTVEDLKRYKVATVMNSSTEGYLDIFGVSHTSYPEVAEALNAIEEGAVHMVVYDRPIMSFHLMRGAYRHLALSPNNLKTDYYCFTYPKNSKLKGVFDPHIVKVLRSNTWNIKLRLSDNI